MMLYRNTTLAVQDGYEVRCVADQVEDDCVKCGIEVERLSDGAVRHFTPRSPYELEETIEEVIEKTFPPYTQLTPHRERGGTRCYPNKDARDRDRKWLKREGFNHFTEYRDTQGDIALSYGIADYPIGETHIQHHNHLGVGNGWMKGHPGYDLLY